MAGRRHIAHKAFQYMLVRSKDDAVLHVVDQVGRKAAGLHKRSAAELRHALHHVAPAAQCRCSHRSNSHAVCRAQRAVVGQHGAAGRSRSSASNANRAEGTQRASSLQLHQPIRNLNTQPAGSRGRHSCAVRAATRQQAEGSPLVRCSSWKRAVPQPHRCMRLSLTGPALHTPQTCPLQGLHA